MGLNPLNLFGLLKKKPAAAPAPVDPFTTDRSRPVTDTIGGAPTPPPSTTKNASEGQAAAQGAAMKARKRAAGGQPPSILNLTGGKNSGVAGPKPRTLLGY